MIRIIFFLFSCAFLLSSSAFTQTDSMEWAPVGAKWWYTYGGGTVISDRFSFHAVTLESVSDTIVNEKNSRILDIRVHWEKGYYDTIPHYFLRDFPDQKLIIHQQGDSVFYLRKNKFELLYDFSLEVGDTGTVVTPRIDAAEMGRDTVLYYTVDSVGTTEINGQILRVQKLRGFQPDGHISNYLFGEEIIEKVGNTAFFLPFSDLECDANCPLPLRCYQENDFFYKRVEVPCDTVSLLESSNQFLPGSKNITLYPNPVSSGNTNMQVKGMEVDFWVLRDMHGKILYRRESDAGTSEIDLPQDIRTGIYLIELRSRSQRYVKRLVVQ